MGIYMPVFNCAGNLDGNRFPIYAAGRKKAKISHISPSPETLVEGINNWARVNHASEIKLADIMNLENRTDISEEERGIGTRWQRIAAERSLRMELPTISVI